jgi:FkbM family methyltransferase
LLSRVARPVYNLRLKPRENNVKQQIKAALVRAIGYRRFLRLTHSVRTVQERLFPGEFSALSAMIRPGSVIFDVGANIGYTARLFAKTRGSTLFAIEPDEDNLACLRATIGRLRNVSIVACGAGSEDGRASFSVPIEMGVKQHALGRMASTGGTGETVLRSVDSLRRECGPIGLLKIDVEGFEGHVLDGMMRTVREDRPLVYVEVCGERNLAQWRDVMASLSYDSHVWRRTGFERAEVGGNANYLFVPRDQLAAA